MILQYTSKTYFTPRGSAIHKQEMLYVCILNLSDTDHFWIFYVRH